MPETIKLSVPNAEDEPQEGQEDAQEPGEGQEGSSNPVTPTDPQEGEQDPPEDAETFPRAYVEKLRRESAGHRDRAKRADDLAAALWTARVSALGRLADPTDLPMPADADPMDADAVSAAVDELLSRKAHLAARRVTGNVGQGQGNSAPASFSLGGLLRSHA